jgi:hypothetical protein
LLPIKKSAESKCKLCEKRWLERFSVDVNRNSKGVPRGAQIRFELL